MSPVMTEEEKQKKFLKDYEKVCQHHGLMIVPVAQLKQSMDSGEYTIVAVSQVVQMPEKK